MILALAEVEKGTGRRLNDEETAFVLCWAEAGVEAPVIAMVLEISYSDSKNIKANITRASSLMILLYKKGIVSEKEARTLLMRGDLKP